MYYGKPKQKRDAEDAERLVEKNSFAFRKLFEERPIVPVRPDRWEKANAVVQEIAEELERQTSAERKRRKK
jgi:cell fate (sporulation/competence/biofilm development) regulator YmcA (YheA/YmcA/DUF963 family)